MDMQQQWQIIIYSNEKKVKDPKLALQTGPSLVKETLSLHPASKIQKQMKKAI